MRTGSNNHPLLIPELQVPVRAKPRLPDQPGFPPVSGHIAVMGGGPAGNLLRRALVLRQVATGAGVIALSADPEHDLALAMEDAYAAWSDPRALHFLSLDAALPALTGGAPSSAYNMVAEGTPEDIATRVLTLAEDAGHADGAASLFREGVVAVVSAYREAAQPYQIFNVLHALRSPEAPQQLDAAVKRVSRARKGRTLLKKFAVQRFNAPASVKEAFDDLIAQALYAVSYARAITTAMASTAPTISIEAIIRNGEGLCVIGSGHARTGALLRAVEHDIACALRRLAGARIKSKAPFLVALSEYSPVARIDFAETLLSADRVNVGYLLPLGTATQMQKLYAAGLAAPVRRARSVAATRTARGATGLSTEGRGSLLADEVGLSARVSTERLIGLKADQLLVTVEGAEPHVLTPASPD